MYNDLEYKNKIVVGLIITFALLFFCAGVSVYQYFLPVVTLQVNSVTIRQHRISLERSDLVRWMSCRKLKYMQITVGSRISC